MRAIGKQEVSKKMLKINSLLFIFFLQNSDLQNKLESKRDIWQQYVVIDKTYALKILSNVSKYFLETGTM